MKILFLFYSSFSLLVVNSFNEIEQKSWRKQCKYRYRGTRHGQLLLTISVSLLRDMKNWLQNPRRLEAKRRIRSRYRRRYAEDPNLEAERLRKF